MRDSKPTVVYTAAHAEYPDSEPLGGGKAVADYLIRVWREQNLFSLTVLSPRSLDLALPRPLTEMNELQYARFCRQFERAATVEIFKRDPESCVLLSNDISEGPDFDALGKRGYRIVTIFHVDVVQFFTKFYLRGIVQPETAAKYRAFKLLPDVLRLVFEKQYECVRHSARIVVPSEPMRGTILRCYPWCAMEKIVVIPWGDISGQETARPAVAPYRFPEDEFVIMTLSRLSPEKGIERLLEALKHLGTMNCSLRVFICGAPAYMKGRKYERKLKRLAVRLDSVRVEFPGHVTGPQKTALLQRADLFVSPSLHESYGLTVAEAQAAGCRVISHPHYGASGQVVDCSDPKALAATIQDAISAGRTKKAVGEPSPSPTNAADRLRSVLLEVGASGAQNRQKSLAT